MYMNTVSKYFLKSFKIGITFLLMVVIAKSIGVGMLYFLPSKKNEQTKEAELQNIQVSFRAKQIFNIQDKQTEKPKPKPKETKKIYSLDAIKLKAIFYSKNMSFITLEDKKEIKFLDIGESFKGIN